MQLIQRSGFVSRAVNFTRHKRDGARRSAATARRRYVSIFDRTSIAKYEFDRIISVRVQNLYYPIVRRVINII